MAWNTNNPIKPNIHQTNKKFKTITSKANFLIQSSISKTYNFKINMIMIDELIEERLKHAFFTKFFKLWESLKKRLPPTP